MNFIFFSLGIIFLQLTYIASHYSLFRQKEFLYFTFFSISVTAFTMLRIFPNLNPYHNIKGEDFFSSLYGLILIAFAMYARFLRIFLDIDINYPKMNKAFIFFEKITIPFGILILILGLLSLQHYSIKIFAVVYILSLPFYLTSIFYLGTRKRTINRIMLTGTLLAMIISRTAALQHFLSGDQNFQLNSFEYIIASIVVLFLFLNLGLLYKSKLAQMQNIQMEVQKQSELSHQRAMISADLHDDLGASLSSIHLNAIMIQKSLHIDTTKTETSLKGMVEDLKLVIENMGDIIWAINTDKQVQKSISGQIKDFYFDLMDGYNIESVYEIDEHLESQITNVKARKNLLLIIKEAINNILKHANSTLIQVRIKEQDNQVLLEIQDNGIGIQDAEGSNMGNGLNNMKNRTEKLDGVFTIKSEAGVGTTISCLIPLTNIRYMPPVGI